MYQTNQKFERTVQRLEWKCESSRSVAVTLLVEGNLEVGKALCNITATIAIAGVGVNDEKNTK